MLAASIDGPKKKPPDSTPHKGSNQGADNVWPPDQTPYKGSYQGAFFLAYSAVPQVQVSQVQVQQANKIAKQKNTMAMQRHDMIHIFFITKLGSVQRSLRFILGVVVSHQLMG